MQVEMLVNTQRRRCAALAAVLVLSLLMALPLRVVAAPEASVAEVESNIVAQTNAFRRGQNLAPLTVDPHLERAAGDFAAFMARTGEYGHGAGGTTPAQRAERAGYAYCVIAENIGFQYSSAGFTTDALTTGFMQGWRESPGHRRNMLKAGLTEIGVGVAQSAASGRWYAVQLLGRPESRRQSFSIRNATERPVTYRLGDAQYELAPRTIRTHSTCTPATLRLRSPQGLRGTSLEPEDGAALRIEAGDDGRLRLRGR
jgi:uncharacterized protein YkwD